MSSKPEHIEVVQSRIEWRCDECRKVTTEILDGPLEEHDDREPPKHCSGCGSDKVYFWGATRVDDSRREFEKRAKFVQDYAAGWRP